MCVTDLGASNLDCNHCFFQLLQVPVLLLFESIEPDVYEAWKFAAAFLDPILADSVPRSARWDHRDQQWRY